MIERQQLYEDNSVKETKTEKKVFWSVRHPGLLVHVVQTMVGDGHYQYDVPVQNSRPTK